MDIRDRLAANLRRIRHEKGWSQEEFAHEADIHRTYISDLERAARNPSIEVIEKLAKTLKVNAGQLLD
ncbi:helix-turn-helix domain-containing protein [Erythrobacter crassostreae]|uniref:Helix-turn-helix transcriptional regulator n=1 Tax=Erythrobacter crassostreae TaxID=2828328 RepID=A0A9X1F2S6_9SPHN|nr:helix-turn-helix transcriptional regulator [Erythrobacter crassostrea]